MLTITDYIIGIVVVFSTYRGWHRGFLRSLIGPFSLAAGSIFSFLYFQKTHDFLLSLLIGVLGPLLLNILLAFLLGIWQKKSGEDKPIRLGSRILGALFNLSWNAGILILFLVWILLIPGNIFGLTKIQDDVRRSLAFSVFNQFVPNHFAPVDRLQNTWRVLNDPAERKIIESSPEYRALSQDEKIQSILADQDLIDQIQRREMAKVLSNPKIQEIVQDQELLKKFLALESSILRKEPPQNSHK